MDRTPRGRGRKIGVLNQIRTSMLKTVEGVLDKDGSLHLLEDVELSESKRVLVVFLEQEADEDGVSDTSRLSEESLGEDWNRKQEDAAWQHLQ